MGVRARAPVAESRAHGGTIWAGNREKSAGPARPSVHYAPLAEGAATTRPSLETHILTTSPWRARPLLALTRPLISSGLALAFEMLGVLALMVLALLVRLDDYMVVPRLTDETLEVQLGLRLAREGGLPLVGYAPHIGSLFTYLTAGAFLLLGPKIEAGRLVVMTAGVLTILPTYLLGRDLGRRLGQPSVRSGSMDSVMRGRLVGLIAALLLAVSGPHVATSSRIAYSNSLTPLFIMLGLWLANRAIGRRSDLALAGSGAALGLALQTHVSALTVGPGVLAALLMPWLMAYIHRRRAVTSSSERGLPARSASNQPRNQSVRRPYLPDRRGLEARAPSEAWPRWTALLTAAGIALLMVANLLIYNLMSGPATLSTSGNRIGRYVGDEAWTVGAWSDRVTGLLKAAALAIGGYTSEVEAPASALLSPMVVVSVALVLLGLWVCARRRAWLPLLVTVSVIFAVSLFNERVEPIVPRVRHYMTLVPLGMIMIGVALVWLHDRVARLGGVRPATVLLALVPVLMAFGLYSAYDSYEDERLTRPDKNNAAYLAVLDAVAASGEPDERLYLDDQLSDILTMSGGRMLTHLRYAFTVRGQELDTIEIEDDHLPIGRRGTMSRRVVLNANNVEEASKRYRLVPLPGEPGEGAPLRAFRAFPLHE